MKPLDDISFAAQELNSFLSPIRPSLAIVLGSGLSGIITKLEQQKSLPYEHLTGFPATVVKGHTGRIHVGTLYGVSVLIFNGRYHLYEGYDAWQVTAPVRLAAQVGCQKILLTNAAGGIDALLSPGDFLLVTDHLNFTGVNPLIGRPELAFVDLCQLYAQDFYAGLRIQLAAEQIHLQRGILAWMTGPSYETPAEVNALESLGASAVSMSVIPEAIIARRYGLEVAAISLITNLAAGRSRQDLNHEDVLQLGSQSARTFELLLKNLFVFWPSCASV